MPRILWARSHLRWTERQWKRVLWSDESTFQLVFGKNGHRILCAKDEKDHPDCYQQKVQKPASVMVWGCISAHSMGDLHICEGTIDAEAYVGILEMLPPRLTTFPRNSMSISAGQCQAFILHKLQQCGFVGIECVCLTACLQSRSVSYWKCMVHHEEENQTTANMDCWAAHVLYTPRMGKNSTCKTATIDIFSSQSEIKRKGDTQR